MTSIVKHARANHWPWPLPAAAEQRRETASCAPISRRGPAQRWWPHTAATAEQVQQRRLTPDRSSRTAEAPGPGRRRGVAKLLRLAVDVPG